MPFVHLLWFSVWVLSGLEQDPYGLLTMIGSPEAILLSTFVMISQHRADEQRQVLADHQWQTVQEEAQPLQQQLLELSNQILARTRAIHALGAARSPPAETAPSRHHHRRTRRLARAPGSG